MQSSIEPANAGSSKKFMFDGLRNNFYTQLTVVIILSALLELQRAAFFHGFARAESCFVEGAREMLINNQYVAPLFYGVPYFDKPPLHYWLIISIYKLLGVTLIAARIISILSAVATIAVLAVFVKRVLGASTALLSAVILATTIGFFEFGAVAMPDMLLCLFENLAIFSAYMIFIANSNYRLRWLFIMVTAFAFGWMTKGPVAIVIPGITLLISMFLFKKMPRLSFKEILLSAIIFLAILLPWHVSVYKNYGMPAFNWLYVQGNFDRFMGHQSAYNFGHKPGYMITTLLGNFLPWTIFLIPAIGQIILSVFNKKQSSINSKFILLLLIWSFCNTAFFSLSSSNWNYYSLPIYPALAIITAHFLIDLKNRYSPRKVELAYAIIAVGFFIVMSTYAIIFLPIKAKKDSYLNFVQPINQISEKIPFFFHLDLLEQSLLTDYTSFETKRLPVYCDQEKLKKMIITSQPFIVLIPKQDFENLQASTNSKLKVIETEPYPWVNFPGCKLINESEPGKPISIILASYNPTDK